MDWQQIELVVFSAEASAAEGSVYLPEDDALHRVRLEPYSFKTVIQTGNKQNH